MTAPFLTRREWLLAVAAGAAFALLLGAFYLSEEELRAEVQKFVTKLCSRPKEDQLAFARQCTLFVAESLDDHRARFNALSPNEQLYAQQDFRCSLMRKART